MNVCMPADGASLDMNDFMFQLLHGHWWASASLGTMRALLGKLDILLVAPPQGCSSKRVKDEMRLLKGDVEEISSYLDELSEVEDPPPVAKCWMNEARDLSYDMEDYIDSLLFMPPDHLNSKKYEQKNKKKQKKLITSHVRMPKRLKWCKRITYVSQVYDHGNTVSVCRNIHVMIIARPLRKRPKNTAAPEMISRFRTYIQDAIERHDRYKLHCYSTLRRCRFLSTGRTLPTPAYEQSTEIVIDGQMNEFINSLSLVGDHAEDQHLKVVSILGPGCLGKTTLARVLYNRIRAEFDCRAFIRVSQKPDMKRLFCDVFSQLHQKKQSLTANCNEPGISDNIRKHLEFKRYLIVIDDLWDASVWDIIKYAFPERNRASRIIITTQIEDVALACCSNHPEHVFEMKPLDVDHSRELFFNRLFGSESDCPAEFKQVSNKIVDVCGGLPLATINIASLLANQHTAVSTDLLAYTNDLLRSYMWSNSTSERTRQVLNLSYNSLPHYLKTCLLYFRMYPEGSIICKDDLVKQWVAEGFIATGKGKGQDEDTMEKTAGIYFDELIDRRFVQPLYISYNNKVCYCTVHDVVHDIIAQKSAEENFIEVVSYNRKNITLHYKVRRLSLAFGDAKYAKTPANIRKSQVRSLSLFGLFECMPCIREFKLLRVLNLQLYDHHGDHDLIDLTGISELFQLRYLKIASDVCIKLPNRMQGLKCLETLDVVDGTRVTDVPWDIVHLPHLLHLTLPVDTNFLDWIGSMGGSVISQWSLGKLNYMQYLHLTSSFTLPPGSLERSMEALGSIIGGHCSLKTVIVAHGSSIKNTVVHGASKVIIPWDHMAPPPLLQRFEFSPHSCCLFSRIPVWIGELGNLCILKIPVRELKMVCVDILRGLHALTALSLYVETAPIHKIIFDKAGFTVLKYFKLRCRSGIPCLEFEADAMPNLWKLKLGFNAIPRMGQHELIWIGHMPGLKEISIIIGGTAGHMVFAMWTVVINHLRNPAIDMQFVDYSSYSDKSTKCNQEPDEIVEGKKDEYNKRLERPADKRISTSLERSSSRLHTGEITAKLTEITGSGDEGREHMFDKVLTSDDVGKLDRLEIPKQHAEKHFPLEDRGGKLMLSFEDRGGKLWRFCYYYWYISQSYVLTNGWKGFVKEKCLNAGDTISFATDATHDRLFIDWTRRAAEVRDSHSRLPMRWWSRLPMSRPLSPRLPMSYAAARGFLRHPAPLARLYEHDLLRQGIIPTRPVMAPPVYFGSAGMPPRMPMQLPPPFRTPITVGIPVVLDSEPLVNSPTTAKKGVPLFSVKPDSPRPHGAESLSPLVPRLWRIRTPDIECPEHGADGVSRVESSAALSSPSFEREEHSSLDLEHSSLDLDP
uniref:Uncharacterized protein n=1 Tax=Avena sativa TaxID=4498 RepID=A0ACD5YA35_AVESA